MVEGKPPFLVVLIDTLDTYYYADIFDDDRIQPFGSVDNLGKAKAIADALFVVKNYKWDSLGEMNELDAGFDARVYDADFSCVYKAHERFSKKWIGR